MTLIECVPNVSEGRRLKVVDRMASALRSVAGVRLLDSSSDPSHNRSVFTMIGDADALEEAVLALYGCAAAEIDMRRHRGVHPRFGAVDVVPFVPLAGTSMDACVALAKRVGQTLADRFSVPIFLYAEAASAANRRHLADIRRGQFEGLAVKMTDSGWMPDFGPSRPHPTLGACAVGARRLLVAYNVNLATTRIDVATAIAAAIRESNGGLPGVKAIGVALPERGIVQVSVNLTNHTRTSLVDVWNAVKARAAQHGVEAVESEIVGLAPVAALRGASPGELQLTHFTPQTVLEYHLAALDADTPPRA
ncbi:MAG: glutamate formimidoyltransferase [Acidobacteria bacterium]|nr:MAG: glutamate formimidoyltransferase [Acidobacteriota bacterium]